jgi:hypothetical protein
MREVSNIYFGTRFDICYAADQNYLELKRAAGNKFKKMVLSSESIQPVI